MKSLGKVFLKLYKIPCSSRSSMKDVIADFTLIIPPGIHLQRVIRRVTSPDSYKWKVLTLCSAKKLLAFYPWDKSWGRRLPKVIGRSAPGRWCAPVTPATVGRLTLADGEFVTTQEDLVSKSKNKTKDSLCNRQGAGKSNITKTRNSRNQMSCWSSCRAKAKRREETSWGRQWQDDDGWLGILPPSFQRWLCLSPFYNGGARG